VPPASPAVARRDGCLGFALIVYLATHGFDRAIMLIPTWVLLLVWTFAAWLTVTGHLVNDVVQPALAGGLVLIVLLIGFTVMQHAFAGGVVVQGAIGETERRALALTGAGDIVWDWDVLRDRIYTGPEAEDLLGLRRGALEAGARLAGGPPSRRPRPLQGLARCGRNPAAAASPRISACARKTVITVGSTSAPARCSAAMARCSAASARSST
jgi:PAS domain-containing protein